MTCKYRGCSSLTSIVIPESVTSIGRDAFRDCSSLASVTIPEGVVSISPDAFEGTAWYDALPDGVIYMGAFAYKYKGEMPENTQLTLREGTERVGDAAFRGCKGLASITLPDGLTTIGKYAFYGCGGLNSFTVPESVTSIGSSAFDGCRGLTDVRLGRSITNIEELAFANCSKIEDFYCYAAECPSVARNAFENSYVDFITLHVPEASLEQYRTHRVWGKFAEIVPIVEKEPVAGDIDGDGRITVSDITALIGIYLDGK